MKQKILLLCFGGILLPIVGMAQVSFTFRDAILSARTSSPEYQIEQYKVAYSEAVLLGARIRPNITLNNQFLQLMEGSNKAPGSNLMGAQNRQVWYQATKVIQLGNARQKRISLAQQLVGVSKTEVFESQRQIVFKTGELWLELWLNAAKLGVFNSAKQNIDTLVRINEVRLKNGFIAPIELLRTQLLSEQYELRYKSIERDYLNKLNDFKTFLNRQDSIKIHENSEMFLIEIPSNLDSLIQISIQNRPDIQMLKFQQDWYKKNQVYQRALKSPFLEVGGILNPQNGIVYAGTFATLSIPVFNRNQEEIRKSQVYLDQNNVELLYKENQIRNQVRNAYNTYSNNKEIMEKFEKIMSQSTQVLSTIRYSYLRGNTSIIDFLDAQRSFLDTQELYNEAVFNYRKSYLEVLYVTGLINSIQ